MILLSALKRKRESSQQQQKKPEMQPKQHFPQNYLLIEKKGVNLTIGLAIIISPSRISELIFSSFRCLFVFMSSSSTYDGDDVIVHGVFSNHWLLLSYVMRSIAITSILYCDRVGHQYIVV